MIGIVDYGVGNFGSILQMLKRNKIEAAIVKTPTEISEADHLIFPGMGAFDVAMTKIDQSGILPMLEKRIFDDKIPVLGICLGMQLFVKGSEEGKKIGLSWIDGYNIRFKFKTYKYIKIPLIGWNNIEIIRESPLLKEVSNKDLFYFAHSYHLTDLNNDDIVAKTNYGYDFVSVINYKNIYGVQFHPERSHESGLKLLKNFSEI